MHIPTHVLSGWVFANALPLAKRERLFCMVAASIPDIDGLGFFFGEEMFWRFHHFVGHNVFFGLFVSIAVAFFSQKKLLALAAYMTCFHLHLLMDFYGSGTGWKIHYFWPIDSRGFYTTDAWPLSSWQNYLTFGVLLLITIGIAWRKKRTPLELLAPRLEAKLFPLQPTGGTGQYADL